MRLIVFILLFVGAPAFAGDPPPLTAEALESARTAAQGDPAKLRAIVASIDAEITRTPKDPWLHHARAMALLDVGDATGALAAYEAAVAADPRFAAAWYGGGVLLADLGRDGDAIRWWETALAADPTLLDAAYNLGQAHYNRNEFETALRYWQKSATPQDFQTQKKILQALNALGRASEAKAQRDLVLALVGTSPDPAIKAQKELVFHQWKLGKWHVYAIENLAPGGMIYPVYTWRVEDATSGQLAGTIEIETAEGLRELGTPYLLTWSQKAAHGQTGIGFKTLPDPLALTDTVNQVIEKKFGPR